MQTLHTRIVENVRENREGAAKCLSRWYDSYMLASCGSCCTYFNALSMLYGILFTYYLYAKVWLCHCNESQLLCTASDERFNKLVSDCVLEYMFIVYETTHYPHNIIFICKCKCAVSSVWKDADSVRTDSERLRCCIEQYETDLQYKMFYMS